jgi:aspartate kinase
MRELKIEPHLVCSAMGKTTNNLIAAGGRALAEGVVDLSTVRALHEESALALGIEGSPQFAQVRALLDECEKLLEGVAMLGELSPRTSDKLVAFGERMSGRMVAAQLQRIGVTAVQYESWDLGVLTNSVFGDASVLDSAWPLIRERVRAIPTGTVGVITGFIGKDADGQITTLGRGGSDLTASLIGAAAGFDEVQVWKDVDGIMTADPRACPAAKPVPFVTFEEAQELAYFGAQVLHPVAMQPAMRVDIPVRVKNSYNPSAQGTLITRSHSSQPLVSAITSKTGVQMVDIVSTRMLGQYGFLATVFTAFETHKLSVDVIASSEVSVSLTLNKKVELPRKERGVAVQSAELDAIAKSLSAVAEVRVTTGHSIITLIADVRRSSSVMAIVFEVMARLGIQVEMMSQGASKVNISLVVPEATERVAVAALHKCFFEDANALNVPSPAALAGATASVP